MTLLITAAAAVGLTSSTARAQHPYFLAVTIDDPKTIVSVRNSQKQLKGLITPYAPQDLHISLVLFGEPLNHDQKCELHKKIAGVVSGLAKYGPIKLAHNIKSGDFRVSDKGYTVYRLKDSGILKIIAKNSAKAVTKTNKPKKECLFKLPMCDARDFDPKPNVHISFGKFDPARKINGQKISTHLGRTFLPFSSPKAEMGYTLIDPPNATDNRILDKIYLKQSNGKHYIDRDCWLLPHPHNTKQKCTVAITPPCP